MEPPADAVVFPLSELSKARLRRHSILSFLGAMLTAVLIVLSGNTWLFAGFALFLGLFVYRRFLLILADPHAIVDAVTVELRWLRRERVRLADISAAGVASELFIVLLVGKEEPARQLRLARWRFEDRGAAFLALIRARCGPEDDETPSAT